MLSNKFAAYQSQLQVCNRNFKSVDDMFLSVSTSNFCNTVHKYFTIKMYKEQDISATHCTKITW